MFEQALRFKGYPVGAIKTQGELQDIVTEARKKKKAIRLYEVSQSGYFSELFITSKSRIEAKPTSPDLLSLSYFMRSTSGRKRYFKTTGCLGDRNVVDKHGRHSGHNRHFLFANKALAQRYANELSTDADYIAAVKRHHAECERLFSRIWA